MSQTVTIRPYIDPNPLNEAADMGLGKQGLVIADGCNQSQNVAFVDNNGIKTYINGLNENSKEIQSITDPVEKQAHIVDIRKTAVYFENAIAGNYEISNDDIFVKDDKGKNTDKLNPNFWTKVTKFKAVWPDKLDNNNIRIPTYWDSVEIRVGNQPYGLDQTAPHDAMLMKIIEAGGFGDIIAPSLERARSMVKPPKFYLDREENTMALQTETKKLRNQAGGKLQHLYEKDMDKLFYILKNIGFFSLGYRKNTPNDILYDDADKFLDGNGVDRNKRPNIEKFLDLCKEDLATLKIKAVAKDASSMNLIAPKGDGNLYYIKKGIPVGKTFEDVVMYLNNPMNSAETIEITSIVEKEWAK